MSSRKHHVSFKDGQYSLHNGFFSAPDLNSLIQIAQTEYKGNMKPFMNPGDTITVGKMEIKHTSEHYLINDKREAVKNEYSGGKRKSKRSKSKHRKSKRSKSKSKSMRKHRKRMSMRY